MPYLLAMCNFRLGSGYSNHCVNSEVQAHSLRSYAIQPHEVLHALSSLPVAAADTMHLRVLLPGLWWDQ